MRESNRQSQYLGEAADDLYRVERNVTLVAAAIVLTLAVIWASTSMF